jgi:DNA-binding GntR family transcriptional regulator
MALPALRPLELNRSPRYRETAYNAIKEAILSGAIPPHQPLVEEQLAASLAISRTPVREALAILEHEGLIGPRGGRGLYVCTLSREEFVAMFVANEAVEPYLVRRAALRATEEHLATMAVRLEDAGRAVAGGDLAGFLRASRDFHRLVGEASGNQPLTRFVVANEERTDMYLLSEGKQIEPAKMEASNREHAAILAALVARDPEDAARLTIYHAQALRQRLADLFAGPQEE